MLVKRCGANQNPDGRNDDGDEDQDDQQHEGDKEGHLQGGGPEDGQACWEGQKVSKGSDRGPGGWIAAAKRVLAETRAFHDCMCAEK